MAIIKCPECGKDIDDQSVTCIHCGCVLSSNTDGSKSHPAPEEMENDHPAPKRPDKSRMKKILFVSLAVIVIAILIFAMVRSATEYNHKNDPESGTVQNEADTSYKTQIQETESTKPMWERDQEEVMSAVITRIENQDLYYVRASVVKKARDDGGTMYQVEIDGASTFCFITLGPNEVTGKNDFWVFCMDYKDENTLMASSIAISAVYCECDTKGNFESMEDANDELINLMESANGITAPTKEIGGVAYSVISVDNSNSILFTAGKPE